MIWGGIVQKVQSWKVDQKTCILWAFAEFSNQDTFFPLLNGPSLGHRDDPRIGADEQKTQERKEEKSKGGTKQQKHMGQEQDL